MNRFTAVAVLGVFTVQAAANDDFEIRVGTGTNCAAFIEDGRWKQDGLDNHVKPCGDIKAIQLIGKTRFAWLDYSLGYAVKKGASAGGEYVSDDCYLNRQYSGGELTYVAGLLQMGTCDRRYFVKKVEDSSKSFLLTLNPTYRNGEFLVSTSLGLSFYKTTTRIEWDTSKGMCSYVENGCPDLTSRKSGISPYAELTVKYSHLFVTFYRVMQERADESISNGSHGMFAGLAIGF